MIEVNELAMIERLRSAVKQDIVTATNRHEAPMLKWTVTVDDSSPWLLIDCDAAEPYSIEINLPRHFAMWRATRDIYRVVQHEVVEDPVLVEAIKKHGPVLEGV